MSDETSEREQRMRSLAAQLFFDVKKNDARFSLYRNVDVAEPVREEGLTLEEAEELLHRWKLRGFHGG